MAEKTWYAVNASLDMYDTGTGWEYTIRYQGPDTAIVNEYRKDDADRKPRRSMRVVAAKARQQAMEWAASL